MATRFKDTPVIPLIDSTMATRVKDTPVIPLTASEWIPRPGMILKKFPNKRLYSPKALVKYQHLPPPPAQNAATAALKQQVIEPIPPESDLTQNPSAELVQAMHQAGLTEDPTLAASLDMFVAETVFNREHPRVVATPMLNRRHCFRTNTLTDNCMALACRIYGHGINTPMNFHSNTTINDLTGDELIRAEKFLTYLLSKYKRVSRKSNLYEHKIVESEIRNKNLRSISDNANNWCKKSVYSVEWMYHVMQVLPVEHPDHHNFNHKWMAGIPFPSALHFAYLLPEFKKRYLKGKNFFLCDDQKKKLLKMPCIFPERGRVSHAEDSSSSDSDDDE